MGQGEMLFRASKSRDSEFWSRWLNALEGHRLGVSNEHPAIDELSHSNAIGEMNLPKPKLPHAQDLHSRRPD